MYGYGLSKDAFRSYVSALVEQGFNSHEALSKVDEDDLAQSGVKTEHVQPLLAELKSVYGYQPVRFVVSICYRLAQKRRLL